MQQESLGLVGAWDSGTTYNVPNVVTRNGAYYISLTNSNAGNDPLTSTSNWEAFSGGTSSGTSGSGSTAWGSITGTLANQSDLSTALAGKQASLGFAPENVATKGQADGYAPLGSDSKVPAAYLPASSGGSGVSAGIFGYSATFNSAGSITVTHNLGDQDPLLTVYVDSGCKIWRWVPIDANSGTIYCKGPAVLQLRFLSLTSESTSGSGGSGSGTSIAIPTNGLKEYWPMTDGSGTSCGNAVVPANPLTLTSIAWQNVSGFNSAAAASFSGAASSGAFGTQVDSASNWDGTTPFSISVWFKPAAISTGGNPAIIVSNAKFSLCQNGQQFQVLFSNSGDWLTLGIAQSWDLQITAGTLYHIVLTYDGSGKAAGLKMSFQGSLWTTNKYGPDTDSYSNTAVSTHPWCVGNAPGASPNIPISGNIAGVAIYNRVLTAEEVSQIYAIGAP